MSSNDHDDLDRLLSPPAASADPMLQARLRESTTRALRRRVQVRRVGFATALLGCYAAGLATFWLVQSLPTPLSVETAVPLPSAPQPPTERSPQDLELLAEQADGVERARLYLTAARTFGREFGDWDAALRCYRNALDADPELANAIDPDNDDWLMVTLKNARQKERGHAPDAN